MSPAIFGPTGDGRYVRKGTHGAAAGPVSAPADLLTTIAVDGIPDPERLTPQEVIRWLGYIGLLVTNVSIKMNTHTALDVTGDITAQFSTSETYSIEAERIKRKK